MGCDIHMNVQVKVNGKWEPADVPERLKDRAYPRFAFLTGGVVRNYENLPKILPEPRGLPEGVSGDYYDTPGALEVGEHSYSWLLSSELLAVDYTQKLNPRNSELAHRFEDKEITLGELLGENWFSILTELKSLGKPEDVRLVFGFDS